MEFYAAYFSIHTISYEEACQGRERLETESWELQRIEDKVREELFESLKVAAEMYTRGFEFMPIDLYLADDRKFQIIDGKIMPSLRSIEGMGVLMAAELKEEAKKRPFKSQEDLGARVWSLKSLVRHMAELGILGDLPEMG